MNVPCLCCLLLFAASAGQAQVAVGPETEQALVRLDQAVTELYRTVIEEEEDREDEGGRLGGLARKTVRDIEELLRQIRSLRRQVVNRLGQPASELATARGQVERTWDRVQSGERHLESSVAGLRLSMMPVERAMAEFQRTLGPADGGLEEPSATRTMAEARAPAAAEAGAEAGSPVAWERVDEAVAGLEARVNRLAGLTGGNPALQKSIGGAPIEAHFEAFYGVAARMAAAVKERAGREALVEATEALAGEHRKLMRYSRGKLGGEGAALLQGAEDELAVLETYF